ncbi:hypothetical protein T439DRAFT_305034 [Meredithblackwellia eburnea MCA 4105]
MVSPWVALQDSSLDLKLHTSESPSSTSPLLQSQFKLRLKGARKTSTTRQTGSNRVITPFAPRKPTELEQLTWTTKRVIWSKGSTPFRTFSFEQYHQPILQALFVDFNVPVSSPGTATQQPVASTSAVKLEDSSSSIGGPTFGPFHPAPVPAWTEDPLPLPIHPTSPVPQPRRKKEKHLVILLRDMGFVYPTESGGSGSFMLPFRVRRAWAMSQAGLLLERAEEGNEDPEADSPGMMPTLYSLDGPAEELKVVSEVNGISGIRPTPTTNNALELVAEDTPPTLSGPPTPIQDLSDRIIFISNTNSSFPIIVTSNPLTGKFSIWAYANVPTSEEEEGEEVLPDGGRMGMAEDGNESWENKQKRAMDRTVDGEAAILEALGGGGGGTTMKRSTSLAATNPTDRRGSATRNELSVNLDRMALETGNQGRETREIEREATVLLDSLPLHLGHEGQRRFGDVYLQRVWIGEGVAHSADLSIAIFDSTPTNATLSVLSRSTSTILLFSLSYSQEQSIVAQPHSQHSAIAAMPVLATRPDITDLLLCLTPDGKDWKLLTAGARECEVEIPEIPEGRTVTRLEGDESSQIIVVLDDSSRFTINCPSFVPCSQLALHVMWAISLAVDLDDFSNFQQQVGRHPKSKEGGGGEPLDAIADVLATIFGCEPEISTTPVDDWTNFIQSTQHQTSLDPIASLLRSSPISFPTASPPPLIPRPDSARRTLEAIVMALHLLAEEYRMSLKHQKEYLALATLLGPVLRAMGLETWMDSYARRTGLVFPCSERSDRLRNSHLDVDPPDLTTTLFSFLTSDRPLDFPDIRGLQKTFQVKSSAFYGPSIDPCQRSRQLISLYRQLSPVVPPLGTAAIRSQRTVFEMDQIGWKHEDLENLPAEIAMPLREAMRICQLDGPEGWPTSAYELIRRPDMARQLDLAAEEKISLKISRKPVLRPPSSIAAVCEAAKEGNLIKDLALKSLTDVAPVPKVARFNEDRRVEEVARMLQYSEPVTISAGDRTLDQLTPQVQQSILNSLSNRTLALPVGSAMFLYRSSTSPISESVQIPKINTSARILPMPSPVALVDKEARDSPGSGSSERFEWPEFHSGVAAALQQQSSTSSAHLFSSYALDSSQISFNKPADLDARHAGYLFGLGLTGRIGAMVFNQAYEYLKVKHDPTSIGLLLGLSVTYLGTGDSKVTSLLSVHLAALHPPNASPLNVSGMTQAAGLVGLGLLYLGTQRRTLSDIMVRELCSIKVTSIEDPLACREAYALSAGFAYGLIMLGKGTVSGTAPKESLRLRTFRALILGENNHPLPGTSKGGSRTTSLSNVTDVNITSSAGTIALGLAYLRTERQDVAEILEIPDTTRRLDYLRSDHILLRTLARSMILWTGISSSKAWVESHVPKFIVDALSTSAAINSKSAADGDIDVARWNIVAGACFAMGLKFAGTASSEAHATLIHFLDRLTRAAYVKTSSAQGKIKRHAIRCCLSVVAIALSMVMAGTGEINVLRRIRVAHGHFSEGVTYGTHLAAHMALGLLFVGGGHHTLGTSNTAIAALVIAFFPSFPAQPAENRAHLQAYRHLWTLAVEPRCLQVRDVDTNEPTFLPFKLRLVEQDQASAQTQNLGGDPTLKALVAPTHIPELRLVESIILDSPRYWGFTLHIATNPDHLRAFLRATTIYVKRRTGHLSYAQDPRGIKSIFTRSKSETGSSVFDFGETARILAPSASGLRDFVKAFSDDPEAIAAVAHLCHSPSSLAPTPTPSTPSSEFEAFCASVLLECLTRDKRDIIPLYHSLYASHASLLSTPSPPSSALAKLSLHQFLDVLYLRSTFRIVFGAPKARSAGAGNAKQALVARESLIQPGFVEHLSRELEERGRSLVSPSFSYGENVQLLKSYLSTSAWPFDAAQRRTLASVINIIRCPPLGQLEQLRELVLGLGEAREQKETVMLMLNATNKVLMDAGGLGWSRDFVKIAADTWSEM